MIGLRQTVAPTVEPVDLTTMKNFLRVDFTADDLLISTLISAARQAVEVFLNRALIEQQFVLTLDSFPYFTDSVQSQMAYPPSYYSLPRYSTTLWNYSQQIKLLRPPLISVDRISFISSGDSSWHDLVPVPPLWQPKTVTVAGDLVMDNNGNQQKCVQPGTTNANPPTWIKVVGQQTTEEAPDPLGEGSGPVAWENMGPLPAQFTSGLTGPEAPVVPGPFGTFIADKNCEPGRIFPGPPGNFWPPVLYVPNAVQIHFTAGYGPDAADVPAAIRTAIMLFAANLYENREAATPGTLSEIPNHVKALMWAYRVMDFSPTRG